MSLPLGNISATATNVPPESLAQNYKKKKPKTENKKNKKRTENGKRHFYGLAHKICAWDFGLEQ